MQTKNEAINTIVDTCKQILAEKGEDYSCIIDGKKLDDIILVGSDGVIQRIVSKSFRIFSQLYQQDKPFQSFSDKPDDDIIDLINYGVILLLLRQSQWELEWEDSADYSWFEYYPALPKSGLTFTEKSYPASGIDSGTWVHEWE